MVGTQAVKCYMAPLSERNKKKLFPLIRLHSLYGSFNECIHKSGEGLEALHVCKDIEQCKEAQRLYQACFGQCLRIRFRALVYTMPMSSVKEKRPYSHSMSSILHAT